MILCPNCKHVMEGDHAREPGLHAGLEALKCGRCGHRGLRAKDGFQVLSTAGHEYLLGYGSSSSFLRVELSSIALDLFGAHGLTPAQMATYVAEWALIMGQVSGTIRLVDNHLALSGCYEYYRRQMLRDARVS
ncbi:hypothetical protein [Nitrospira sp. Nam80]